MSNIEITLPSMNAEETLSVFPEIDAAAVVSLASAEGTIQLQQAASDWSSLVQIQVDDNDALDNADTADIKYKLTGSWPSYDSALTFDTAVFDSNGHTTISGVTGDTGVTTLRHALRADMSEDMTGSTEAFDIFSNESTLHAEFGTAAAALQATVSSNWANLTLDVDNNPIVLTNATPAASNPGKHILQQILNNNSHAANSAMVTSLAVRSANTDFIDVPLSVGDKIFFNITFAAPSSVGGQDLPDAGLSSSAPGARDHIFKVEVELI